MGSFRLVGPPVFRTSELAFFDNDYIEKRQLFLRSYQFSRKQTTADRIKSSLVRVRRVVGVKLRAARRLRRLVWLRLRHMGGAGGRRRRFQYRLSALAAGRPRAAAASFSWSPLPW